MSTLSEQERDVLRFEAQWFKGRGAKEQAVRDLFDLTATEYYRRLNQLIDREEALREAPVVVKRLREMRAARGALRSQRRLA